VSASQDARRAYRNWFDSLSGARKGRRIGHPRFRTKRGRQSIRLTRNGFALHGAKLYVAKGSANRAKARHRVAVAHRKVRDRRADHHHKLALRLIRDNQAVAVEDLYVAGLGRTRLAKSVHDAGWAMFVRLLEHKAAQHGRQVVKIGRWAPTSQTCSACGVKDGPKPLGVRAWTCQACGAEHDRDLNAARNILNILVAAGPAETGNACGAGVRPSAMAAVGDEAGTHPSAA
jgi:putative transposase